MLEKLLLEIEKVEEKYGSKLNKPASIMKINIFEKTVKEKFNNMILPKQYIKFLKSANGLDFNGLVIYGVDSCILEDGTDEDVYGFIDINEIWYENEWQKQYIFFGDSDTGWYCFDLYKEIYVELDKPSGVVMNMYCDFNSMLEDVLKSRIS
ncbi:YrhA family protein [Clostridium estertheticum]|uniref:YrhA family protein n=1 Tax=Clostridium estertheticum TaxID=238834 RepID=UPI001C0DCB86|nr:YrhA family protein [Clostridium estertheticum]MBU3185936.1 SMI1/KNR4 family protein [Clostridium estertheticum]